MQRFQDIDCAGFPYSTQIDDPTILDFTLQFLLKLAVGHKAAFFSLMRWPPNKNGGF
jgi:hypothetical protein